MGFEIPSLVVVAFKSCAIYLFIILAIRFFGKKELAQLSVIDLVFILLISNSVQNAMVGTNSTLAGGIVAATSLFVINYIFKFLIRKFPQFSQAVQGAEILLIYEGKAIEKNLDEAMISISELKAAVREHGVEHIAEVTLAILEVDGNISVISRNTSGNKTVHKRKIRKGLRKN